MEYRDVRRVCGIEREALGINLEQWVLLSADCLSMVASGSRRMSMAVTSGCFGLLVRGVDRGAQGVQSKEAREGAFHQMAGDVFHGSVRLRLFGGVHHFRQRPAARAGRRFGANDGGQGGSDVHCLDRAINALAGQSAAGEDDGDEGVVAPGCAVSAGHDQAVEVIDEAVRFKDDKDVAGAPGIEVAQHRLDDGALGRLPSLSAVLETARATPSSFSSSSTTAFSTTAWSSPFS